MGAAPSALRIALLGLALGLAPAPASAQSGADAGSAVPSSGESAAGSAPAGPDETAGGAVEAAPEAAPAAPAAALEDPVAEAQALFRRGLELGTENRWADALEHFRRSFARVPRPSTLFNIGVALGRLGRFVEAIEAFDQLFSGSEPPPPAALAEAERLRAEAVASLGEVTLELEPPTAALFVDGATRAGAGSPRSVELDPGRHVLRATAPDHTEGVLEVSVVAGERTSARLALVPIVPDDVITDPVVPPGRSILEEPAFWIVGGVIVVALGVGIGVGVGLGTAGAPPPYGGSSNVVLLAP